MLSGNVLYVDFGFTSAREYWMEVAEPAYDRFTSDESRENAIAAFVLIWPLHDWLWHEQRPGESTRNSKDDKMFRQQLSPAVRNLHWSAMLQMPVSIAA